MCGTSPTGLHPFRERCFEEGGIVDSERLHDVSDDDEQYRTERVEQKVDQRGPLRIETAGESCDDRDDT